MALSLSICIPTYNRAELLRRCLLRLEQQQDSFREIVISDNASPDATEQVVAELRPRFARLVYFRQPVNRGPMPNFQAVMSLASSDLLFMLHDDDALLPERIADAVALLEADPGSLAVYGGYERCDANLENTSLVAVPRRPGRFGLDDFQAIAETANLLTAPLVRRTAFQRHCFFDDTTFGFLRTIAQLLPYGAIHLVDYPLYRHAGASPNSIELRVGEPWYLEFLRTDWELFVGELGTFAFDEVSRFVASKIVPTYLLAQQAAQHDDRPVHERSFLIRYLAYAANLPDSDARHRIAEWEATRLIAATLERIAERLTLCAGLRRVVIELGRLNIRGMWESLQARFPDIEAVYLDPDGFAVFAQQAGDFLLAESWQALEGRADDRVAERIAVVDMVAGLRVPGSRRAPLLKGPDGSVHFCTDLAELKARPQR